MNVLFVSMCWDQSILLYEWLNALLLKGDLNNTGL